MTAEEAYKVGFMYKCAEMGVAPEVAASKLIKLGGGPAAAAGIGAGIGVLLSQLADLARGGIGMAREGVTLGREAVGAAGSVAKPVLGTILGLGLLGSVGIGVAGGKHLANVRSPAVDIGQIRREEEAEAYEDAIERLTTTLRQRGVRV